MKYRPLVVAGLILGLGGVVAYRSAPWEDRSLPVREKAADFTLLNQNEETVSLGDSRGKVRVLSFFYVRCANAGMCPAETKKLVEVQDALRSRTDDVVFLRVTFDPERDRAKDLRKYAGIYGVDLENWHFLTGRPDEVAQVCSAFDINRKKKDMGQFKHSMLVYLIDRDGRVRRVYAGTFWTPEDVRDDIESLL